MPTLIRVLRHLLAGATLLTVLTVLADPVQARTLRQVIAFGPTALDPVYSTTSGDASVHVNLFEGLARYGADGQVQAAQAQDWTVSADGLAWTFRLRPALRWNDGRPLTSADFVAGFRRLASAAHREHPKAGFLLEPIRGGREVMVGEQPLEALGIEAPDDRTVVIHLDSVTPFLPSMLTHPALSPVPRHVLAQYGAAWTDPAHFVSNGPYRLDGYAHGVWSMSQNPFHHGSVRPQATRVELIERGNGNQALQELLTGKVDIVHAPPTEQLEWLKARQSIRIVSTGATVSNYLALNTADPRLADPRVRQALSMALDRREIMARLSLPVSSVAYSFAVASEPAGWQPIAPPWARWTMERRRERARELMREAGYGPGRRLAFGIRLNLGQPNIGLAGAARSMWHNIYVDAVLEDPETGSAHYRRLADGR
ncbi:MAG: peptide ABC transporter substrate-binding protein [Burkholderiaceae bacterium]